MQEWDPGFVEDLDEEKDQPDYEPDWDSIAEYRRELAEERDDD